MIGLLLARWRLPLSIAAAVAVFGLIAASWHYRHAYHAEKALRRADRASYANAQTEAARIAREALLHQEHIYVTKAQETDHVYQAKLTDADRRANAYIGANRVRGQAAPGVASGAIASAQGSGAQGGERSGAAPDMVAVTAGDIDVCTTNTVRLEAAREWAVGLENRP
jgi:uncharacterized Fe-S center protein